MMKTITAIAAGCVLAYIVSHSHPDARTIIALVVLVLVSLFGGVLIAVDWFNSLTK